MFRRRPAQSDQTVNATSPTLTEKQTVWFPSLAPELPLPPSLGPAPASWDFCNVRTNLSLVNNNPPLPGESAVFGMANLIMVVIRSGSGMVIGGIHREVIVVMADTF